MEINTFFPLTCEAQWFRPEPSLLTGREQSWLLSENSLTAKLKAQCQQFSVHLLGQECLPIHQDEAQFLGKQEPYIVREVLLYCDAQAWVFARSVFPKSLQEGSAIFKQLGNQALGERLFQQQGHQRGEFQIAQFFPETKIHHLCAQLGYQSKQHLWGRRSCFMIRGQKILVQEVFLPPSPLYAHKEPV